ncbi:hypothetical protein [Rhizobium sp. SL86]|uniref:hypothetical protein n=1 Tax=Rhizobium sp. SL86 TaxID=2995148 RepID=UPI0022737A9E|nr:hypothetical protein [Rhizobium sp. SL86]MCY1664255.1 hypothetical protein [Rhizobium sp. SL86]
MTGQKAQPGDEPSAGSSAEWREDLDALQFPVPGHDAHCLVHRLAFRALVGILMGGSAAHDTAHLAAHSAAHLATHLATHEALHDPSDATPQSRPATPDRTACLTLFAQTTVAFHAAARAKILRQAIPAGKTLHLNSRDIRRALEGEAGGTAGRACRVLGG